jgi:uncharacterized OB-fold protein
VNYLELEPKPVLRHEVCDACGARFWGRRNACACCGGEAFHVKDAPDTGVLRAFTIVHRAAPGVPVPFAAAIVELDDATFISANLLSIELDPAAITLGQRVKMTTFVAGTDTEGTEAVAFGFIAVAEQEEALS